MRPTVGASPPWPSSLKFATNTAELSRAENNLQEEGELKKSHCPVYLHLGK